jgi:hypothetical protein
MRIMRKLLIEHRMEGFELVPLELVSRLDLMA